MLILVRHGRTRANAEGRLLGRLDPPLDEQGQEQAARVAAALADMPITAVVSSPLLRTRATAGLIADAAGVTVETDDRWVELDYGEFDGRLLRDVPASMWSAWRRDPAFAPPGGESLADVGLRVRTAMDVLAGRARDEDVVVVSHVSPIKAAAAWVLGAADVVAWRLFLDPASIARVRINPAGPTLVSWNETSHLR